MRQAQYFRLLPNALTISRIGLAFGVLFVAVQRQWEWGLFLLAAALLTDFLDGLAARKLNAQTELGKQLDRRADAILTFSALGGLSWAGEISWWVFAAAPLIALFVAEERFFPIKKGRLHKLRPAISVSLLISCWVFLLLYYLSLAYVWHWWYVVLTMLIFAISASLKRHRLRAWLGISGWSK